MAQEDESADAVFDFLYVDRRRIDGYLAQFSNFGNLTSMVRSTKVSDEKRGDVDVKILKGGNTSRQETALEKHFDAQFIAPLTFLDEVNTGGMLKADTDAARIGDLVLLSGTLNLVDMRAFQKAFETISAIPAPAKTDSRNRQERRANPAPPVTPFDPATGLRLLAALDQPMIMLFETTTQKYWSTIDADALVGSSTDLHLTHGVTIAGEWQAVGILDCFPGGNAPSGEVAICGEGGSAVGIPLGTVLREIKMVMGRPNDCYGVTPQ